MLKQATRELLDQIAGTLSPEEAVGLLEAISDAVENARAVNEQRAGEIAPWHVGRVSAVKIRQSRYSSGSFDGSSLPVLTLGPFLSSCAASYY